MELASRRRMTGSVPQLLKVAADTDPQVRSVAVRKIGELGDLAILPALFYLLGKARASAEIDAAEQAISAICTRAEKPEACAEPVAAQLAAALPAQKGALLRVLSTLGGASALKAVRAAVGDPNTDVRAAAIRALGDWRSAEAAPDLLALARDASNAADKTLCLRAYLGLAANTDLPSDQRLAMCRQAGTLVQRPEEKRLLLSALGSINSLEALGLILPDLQDATVKNEAAIAALGVAERLLRGQDAAKQATQIAASLEKVVQAGVSEELTTRAKNMQQRARERSSRNR
jgi:HEAT repeat protein